MAGLVMLALISLMVVTLIVMAVMRKGWKRILKTFAGFLVAIGLLHLYVVKTCGPNAKDVELMKPQAEAITMYILENGILESLAEIPNLPYKLEKCERKSKNTEYCYFYIDEDEYSVYLNSLGGNYNTYIFMKIRNKKSETGILVDLKGSSKGENFIIEENITPYSTKNDGICNPMKM